MGKMSVLSKVVAVCLFLWSSVGCGVDPFEPASRTCYSAYYGNRRTVAVLAKCQTGGISPETVVGTFNNGQPLTAGELNEIYSNGRLSTCNRDYRGQPWVDAWGAEEICDNFDPKLLISRRGGQAGHAILLKDCPPGQLDFRKVPARLEGSHSIPVEELISRLAGRPVGSIPLHIMGCTETYLPGDCTVLGPGHPVSKQRGFVIYRVPAKSGGSGTKPAGKPRAPGAEPSSGGGMGNTGRGMAPGVAVSLGQAAIGYLSPDSSICESWEREEAHHQSYRKLLVDGCHPDGTPLTWWEYFICGSAMIETKPFRL